jgi:hypothetical protein
VQISIAREIKAQLLSDATAWAVEAELPPTPGAAPGDIAVGVGLLGPRRYGVAVRYSRESPLSGEVAVRGLALAGDDCDIREVGVVRPIQWTPDELRSRSRPLRPGLSVAHVEVTAGTIGAFVRSDGDDSVFLLSNNHVLADSDRGSPGDAVVQPGPADGGSGADRVGVLDRAIALRPAMVNLVDAAIVRLDSGIGVSPAHPAGLLGGWVQADDDDRVEKVGRTTGVTRGRITAIELDGLRVDYPVGTVTFDDQIEVTGDGPGPFSAGGDSGSVIYAADRLRAVGLLFAGSERGGSDGQGLTYCNPFGAVLEQLGVRLIEP